MADQLLLEVVQNALPKTWKSMTPPKKGNIFPYHRDTRLVTPKIKAMMIVINTM